MYNIDKLILTLCLGICIGVMTIYIGRFDWDYKVELNKDGTVTVESKTETKILKDLHQLENYIEKDNL